MNYQQNCIFTTVAINGKHQYFALFFRFKVKTLSNSLYIAISLLNECGSYADNVKRAFLK